MKNLLWFIGLAALIAVMLGCATPSERAQKLFKSGEYEQILARYPNEPVAREARIKLAEKLLKEGSYQKVLDQFADTPSAYHAKERLAAALLDEKQYQRILDDYPDTPAALSAREAVAQQLFDDGKVDDLVQKYPNSKAGQEARQTLGQRAYETAMNLSSRDEKIKALESMMISPIYAGTPVHETVQNELARLHGFTKAK
jgi:hypothetical protein